MIVMNIFVSALITENLNTGILKIKNTYSIYPLNNSVNVLLLTFMMQLKTTH